MKKYILFCLSIIMLFACKSDPKSTSRSAIDKKIVKVPAFSGEAAYAYIEKQLSFGHRVPGMESHVACKDWMVEELKASGATVLVQEFKTDIYTGEKVTGYNVIAQFNPNHPKRIFVAAHWDSRHIADQDADETKRDQPIMGADDGGSGVGVALQIAKTIQANPIDMGVDIILFDVEDQGQSKGSQESWCKGSQYWSRNLMPEKYNADYGILLDMVGSKNPRFAKDQVSQRYASDVQDKIWELADNMGYSDLFVNEPGCGLTDDHYFVNIIANIPTIDIINQDNEEKSCFGDYWHTHNDDISIIDKRSLKVVGQVVTAALYKESGNQL